MTTIEVFFYTAKDRYLIGFEGTPQLFGVTRERFYDVQEQFRKVTPRELRFTITPNTYSMIVPNEDAIRVLNELKEAKDGTDV